MQVKDLPYEIKQKVFEKQIEAGNTPNENVSLDFGTGDKNFHWNRTEEGYSFWSKISNGEFEEFYERYPINPFSYEIY